MHGSIVAVVTLVLSSILAKLLAIIFEGVPTKRCLGWFKEGLLGIKK
jgi:hypothetical protein